jgi:hypothetical protein
MKTLEIPRAQWTDQLNDFTRIHEGWLVSVDILGPEIGVQPEIRNLPLIGISADRVDRDGSIAISVARTPSEHLTHIIQDVARIYIERADNGADAAVEIQSRDGTTTLMTFRVVAPADTVDDVLTR